MQSIMFNGQIFVRLGYNVEDKFVNPDNLSKVLPSSAAINAVW